MSPLERRSSLIILSSAALSSLFPILAKLAVGVVAPITFAAVSVLLSAGIGLIYVLLVKRLAEFKQRAMWWPLLLNALFNITIPYVFFYIGAQYTSGVNTTLLLLAEIPFTVLFTPFFGEPTTKLKLLGAGCVFLGAAAIVWQGNWILNWGDILIILSTVFYPFGNFYAKKAMVFASPATMVFLRSLLGGAMLLLLSWWLEPGALQQIDWNQAWWLIVLNSIGVFGIAKILWFHGFQHLDISKAISLLKSEPLFALVLVAIVLRETIQWYQLVGAVLMLVGVYFALIRSSVPIQHTRYRS